MQPCITYTLSPLQLSLFHWSPHDTANVCLLPHGSIMKTLKKEGIPLSHRHLHGLRSNIILHHKPDPLSSLSLSLFFYLQPLSLLSSHSLFPRSEERKKMAEQLYFYHNQQNENSLLILTILVRTIRVFPRRVGLFFFVF